MFTTENLSLLRGIVSSSFKFLLTANISVYFKCIVKCRIKTIIAWDVIRRTSLSSILHSNVYTEIRKTSRFVARQVAPIGIPEVSRTTV